MALAREGFSTYVWKNQVKSVILLAGFPFLLLVMIFAFFGLLDIASQPPELPTNFDHAWEYGWRGVAHDGYFALIVTAVWFTIAYFFHVQLIRAATGSRPVTRKQMPKIYNMLENLCISRGMTMPSFQIIDSPAMNAFASGINKKTYSITLTRGIVEALPDDELETVIAHELTHIRNNDVRLMMVAVIFVGMISFFSHMLWRILTYGPSPSSYRRSNSKDSGQAYIVIMAIALLVLAIGYFFAIVIRFSLSRKREFLADAGAVELTKNPEALMRALQRISGHDVVKGMPHQVQQMCIENSENFFSLFATHPSVEARLDAISRTTGTEIPAPGVSLRRKPTAPWKDGVPPEDPSHQTSLQDIPGMARRGAGPLAGYPALAALAGMRAAEERKNAPDGGEDAQPGDDDLFGKS
ncbi:MAG: M48 family metalloprotease [Alphaproteobacteria bacterium]|nr:M48 family metalloprotease [Alphaproteobacteria bacterium]